MVRRGLPCDGMAQCRYRAFNMFVEARFANSCCFSIWPLWSCPGDIRLSSLVRGIADDLSRRTIILALSWARQALVRDASRLPDHRHR